MKRTDVVVVGAGLGGVYAVHRFRSQGLAVIGLESADGPGGVWRHNAYPGARVDVDSFEYCYHFSPELYADWRWSERYASQPELLRYIEHVADRFDVRACFRFNTALAAAQWNESAKLWELQTSGGEQIAARFLVMATGNLSAPRPPPFPGLETFAGEWVQSSQWGQRRIDWAGKRVAVIGTGSSGVQTATELAKTSAEVYVFQRTANYAIAAQNGPLDETAHREVAADVPAARRRLLATPGGTNMTPPAGPAAAFSRSEQLDRLEQQWARGGHGMGWVFLDQNVNKAANDVVADFVRDRIRSLVKDPQVAEALCPNDHPIGTRRLVLETGYYEAFNGGNVRLVDARRNPIQGITSAGISTHEAHYEVDLIILALGFHAFTGAMDRIAIRNAEARSPTDGWSRGPRTLLGLMTAGFPNFFMLSGAGSPSVLANLVLQNEYHCDWIADCIASMDARGVAAVEPSLEAQDRWTEHASETAHALLRRQVDNYMVHVNRDDGSRVFIPYAGGLAAYVQHCDQVAADGYRGFVFR